MLKSFKCRDFTYGVSMPKFQRDSNEAELRNVKLVKVIECFTYSWDATSTTSPVWGTEVMSSLSLKKICKNSWEQEHLRQRGFRAAGQKLM